MRQAPSPPIQAQGDIPVNVASFARSLRASNLSPRTAETYTESAHQLARFLAAKGMPERVAKIRREHVEMFIDDLLARWKPATANNRYRGLQSFFRWCLEQGEIKRNPMENMRPPKVPEQPPDVLREPELKAILRTCERGQSFQDRRDHALLRVLIDTGARRAEVAGLDFDPQDDLVNDVDLDRGLLRVLGKGRRERYLPIGHKAVAALDRYLRARAGHPAASRTTALWVGHKGAVGTSGIAQIVRRRGRQAGLGDIHAHQFRHSFAHQWLSSGGAETDLMNITGWQSRTMVQKYAKSTAAERAVNAHRLWGGIIPSVSGALTG